MRRREFIAGLGGAAVSLPSLPLSVRAQQPARPVIGVLSYGASRPRNPDMEALRSGLAEAGYEDGKNLEFEYRWANVDFGRLPALATDLVNRRVAVIVAIGARAPILAAKAATQTIPIVFLYGGDPVTDGLISSLNRPGGNVTGVTGFSRDVSGKRLDLLHQLVPQATTVGFLSGTPNFISYEQQTSSMLAAARALGLELAVVECRNDGDFETAFAALDQRRAGALILGTFPFNNLNKVVELAALHKIPAMYPYRGLANAGGLISYEADVLSLLRQVGFQYVARILNGVKPADLPAQLPTKFELVINLKTAKALGLTIPETLLATADRVIE